MSKAADRFAQKSGALAELIAALPAYEPPPEAAQRFAALARKAQAAHDAQRAATPALPEGKTEGSIEPAFHPSEQFAADFLKQARQIDAAQQARRDAALNQLAEGQSAQTVLGAPLSEPALAWLASQNATPAERTPALARKHPRNWLGGLAWFATAAGVATLTTHLVLTHPAATPLQGTQTAAAPAPAAFAPPPPAATAASEQGASAPAPLEVAAPVTSTPPRPLARNATPSSPQAEVLAQVDAAQTASAASMRESLKELAAPPAAAVAAKPQVAAPPPPDTTTRDMTGETPREAARRSSPALTSAPAPVAEATSAARLAAPPSLAGNADAHNNAAWATSRETAVSVVVQRLLSLPHSVRSLTVSVAPGEQETLKPWLAQLSQQLVDAGRPLRVETRIDAALPTGQLKLQPNDAP